jgi:hypothetical protein
MRIAAPVLILIALIGLANAGRAHGQVRISDAESLGDAIDAGRCVTIQCNHARRQIDYENQNRPLGPISERRPVSQQDIIACIHAEDALGEAIGTAARRVTKNERTSGGVLTFEEAQNIRNAIFNDTYYIRRSLQANISMGNVSQCNALRDRGIAMVNQTYANGMR